VNDTIGGEVARYATAVPAAFADLPGPDRELLLEDLEDHLFLPELRPAWWVLRGYLAVQLVAVATSLLFRGAGLSFPVPTLLGSPVLGLLATVAAVAGSVRLGRKWPGEVRWHAADGRPLRDVYLIDQDGDPVVANNYDNPQLEPERPLDRNGSEVVNRYPQVQHEVDPVTGERRPGPTPEFQPPPGPLRSP
jgi:hypothetical protein